MLLYANLTEFFYRYQIQRLRFDSFFCLVFTSVYNVYIHYRAQKQNREIRIEWELAVNEISQEQPLNFASYISTKEIMVNSSRGLRVEEGTVQIPIAVLKKGILLVLVIQITHYMFELCITRKRNRRLCWSLHQCYFSESRIL